VSRGKAAQRTIETRDLGEIVDTLRDAKRNGRGCTLLIGAGCSVAAKIPTADEFVGLIRRSYPNMYRHASPKTYANCMARLAPMQQRTMIRKYVEAAKINWAHVCIAQLVKADYVDRILTTNFDPLIVRACALFGEFPAVYDFAASQSFRPAELPRHAVFYLHGQQNGFVHLNTPAQFRKHLNLMAPVFEEAGQGRTWIVVGYSGRSDPVFKRLTYVDEFDNNLYWVGFQNEKPAPHVCKELLLKDNRAYYVPGYDADSFFISLAQQLRCFPPDLLEKPFEYLDRILETLTPFPPPRGMGDYDVTQHTRELIRSAVAKIDGNALEQKAQQLLLTGDYAGVLRLYEAEESPALRQTVAWAYVMQGLTARDLATQAEDDATRKRRFQRAYKQYARALEVDPTFAPALNNWGSALFYEADLRPERREELLDLAREKYEQAAKLEPGRSSYNLACLAAVQGNHAECRKRLAEARATGFLPKRSYIERDPDFEGVRHLAWFRKLVGTA
jgi:tetratricopeptide (TPR) repeat protein